MDRIAPSQCANMAEVRSGVDCLDREIVERLAERFRYMEAAARIKPNRSAVRDEWRKADVLAKVRSHAEAQAGPSEAIAQLYEALVEASIAYEFERYDALGKSA